MTAMHYAGRMTTYTKNPECYPTYCEPLNPCPRHAMMDDMMDTDTGHREPDQEPDPYLGDLAIEYRNEILDEEAAEEAAWRYEVERYYNPLTWE